MKTKGHQKALTDYANLIAVYEALSDAVEAGRGTVDALESKGIITRDTARQIYEILNNLEDTACSHRKKVETILTATGIAPDGADVVRIRGSIYELTAA